MHEPVRWGVLGASRFAREQMAPAIHAARGAELVALATSDPAKAEGFRAFAPRLRVHAGYEALLGDPEVEAVYIPLPNHLHVEWTERALAAGKHVLCEKPIALRETEFDRLIAARDRSGRLAAEAFMIVHHPQWQRARELVQGGAIGRLVHVDAAFSYHLTDMANIRNRQDAGGGSLPDIGVYTFGSTRFVTGEEPEAIEHAIVRREAGVDTFAHVVARFPSFTYAGFTSMRMFPRQEVVFHGEGGVLRVGWGPFNAGVFDLAQIVLENSSGARTFERWPGANHYVLQAEAFGRSLREGVPFPCPLEWSRGTQRMIDMVLAAA
ncbi:Gfo/Idh/MocA family protein [Rubellimicrobium sp. CFH 75288]|uniref:Gfo/Idh/MocA family protein n=1 Tax=Rubellimicrobium sp. CFH 75288 TaxID=2697034 RepID=UPI00141349E1|nr:Gfo/Idh/MocA family oxidoreductase [Rubellimicrobium sp. CFH 75288]NAZ37469.1 Gfo/Idh/MocA family oxidoreductase [Rubellimicrobium sp. CFH 75288]